MNKNLVDALSKPIRTCAICRKKREKSQLDRIIIINNEIVIDNFHKVNFFGHYICNDNENCASSSKNLLKKKKMKKIVVSEFKRLEVDETDLSMQKISTLLQFAQKSNSLIFGHDNVVKHIKKKKVCLVIIATDLSENTIRSLEKKTSIQTIRWGSKELFDELLGKYTGIIGICDENFKKGIIKTLPPDRGGNTWL